MKRKDMLMNNLKSIFNNSEFMIKLEGSKKLECEEEKWFQLNKRKQRWLKELNNKRKEELGWFMKKSKIKEEN